MTTPLGTAVVTGGGSGFGAAAAARLSLAGWLVAVLDADYASAQTVSDKVVAAGGLAVAYRCDVSDQAQVNAVIGEVVNDVGEISGLFNNAGITWMWQPWGEVRAEDVRRVFEVNVVGAFNVLNAVVPSMRRNGVGAVVNTASTTSFKGYGTASAAYVASKHATLGLTREAAVELAREGIRVNAVAPGVADTPLMHRVHSAMNPEDPQAAMREFAARIPDGRYATAAEVAEVVAFLLDPVNAHVTGAIVSIDGGEVAS